MSTPNLSLRAVQMEYAPHIRFDVLGGDPPVVMAERHLDPGVPEDKAVIVAAEVAMKEREKMWLPGSLDELPSVQAAVAAIRVLFPRLEI